MQFLAVEPVLNRGPVVAIHFAVLGVSTLAPALAPGRSERPKLEPGRGNYAHFLDADTLRVGGNGAWLIDHWDATEFWGRNYVTMQVAGAVERLGQRGWLAVERLGRDYVGCGSGPASSRAAKREHARHANRVSERDRVGADAKRERNAELVARVLDDGATFTEAAREFGVSRARARQIVAGHLAAAAAEQATFDEQEAALWLRYRRALELVETLEMPGRWALLASVVWPGDELLAASRARALDGIGRLGRERRRCRGCGIAYADGYSCDCKLCRERRRAQRRRAEARGSATARGAAG